VGPPRHWTADEQEFALAMAHVVAAALEARERRRAEQAERRASFLGDATAVLAETLDPDWIPHRLARLAVPFLADACVIDALDDGGIRRLAVAHADRTREPLLEEASRLYPPAPGTPHLTAQAIRSGKSLPIPEVADEQLAAITVDEHHRELLRRAAAKSLMVVPLAAHGQTLGAAAFAASERTFGQDELRLAEELGRRAAIAIDNARLYRKTQQAIRARDEFLSIAAHELYTPLTSLQLAVDGVRQGLLAGDADTSARTAAVAQRQIRRITHLIEDLLNVTRISAGRLNLRLEEVDLAALAREVVQNLDEEFKRAGCAVELDTDAAVIGRWDRARLEQVLVNLLSNAMKFGAGKPVSVAVSSASDRARLVVTDGGIGIAPDRLPHIFERFERAVSSRQFGGLGLGLHIARGIVRAHNCSITAESRPGEGATFVVDLPCSGPQRRDTGVVSVRCDVLLVEDDPDVLEMLTMVLEGNGYRVLCAADGHEALDRLRRGLRPSLILLDLMMPRMDGGTFHAEQQRDPELQAIPVVILTGDGDAARKAATMRVAGHLTKPIDIDRLMQVMRGFCGTPGRSV
jgi:signal transduction histidine kinase